MNAKNTRELNKLSEFDNNNHIAKKKKAVSQQFTKRNMRDIVDLINEEDDELAKKYAQYVK